MEKEVHTFNFKGLLGGVVVDPDIVVIDGEGCGIGVLAFPGRESSKTAL